MSPLSGPQNMLREINYFEIFLPTFDCFDRAESAWAIWFKEIMKLWTNCQSPSWSKVKVLKILEYSQEYAFQYITGGIQYTTD